MGDLNNKGRPIKCLQINLHHAKAASDVLSRRFIWEQLSIALIQEPWTQGNNIRGLPTSSCKLIYHDSHENPRAAILLNNNINFVPVPEFITKDLVAVQVEVPMSRGKQDVIIASAYFPGDDTNLPPPEEVRSLVKHCKRRNKHLILGCDANAHHSVWGSTNNNKRGECLFEYLFLNNIDIVNRGSKPTFRNGVRSEVLDITLASTFISNYIYNWHVSSEVSMSDHRHIRFDIEASLTQNLKYRNAKLTDWNLYRILLKSELQDLPISIKDEVDLETYSNQFTNLIIKSYENSCPVKSKVLNRQVPWWNRKLSQLRTETRKLFNRAKRTNKWSEYKVALTEYNKELRRSKRKSWRQFCEGVNELPHAQRLQKILSKDHSNGLGLLRKPDGEYTATREESAELMLKTHFPDSILQKGCDVDRKFEEIPRCPTNRSKSLAGKIFTQNKIRWAIKSFKPYKSPGEDGIFPALLQQGLTDLAYPLSKIFKNSYLLGYIPLSWREVNVVFIPKAGKRNSEEPKSYRPISLTSFLLKTMEKVINIHLGNEVLSKNPLHKNQYAYQSGKSTETALHNLVTKIEKALNEKEVALCAFIDIEGAFDNTTYESIEKAALHKGCETSTVKWIKAMLASRRIKTKIGDRSATVTAVKGCPQGGVLSPLLWSIVVDSLLNKLNQKGFETQGYADDLVITIRGRHDRTISSLMQNALNVVNDWSKKENLRVNPSKTTLIPFTRRRKLNLIAPTLNGTQINFSSETKYLGIVLDRKLTWNPHLTRTTERATVAYWCCKRLLGKTWGLSPKLIYWSYRTIIRPLVTYAALVWWPKTKEKTASEKLSKVQRLACLGVTGAIPTCPTAALEMMLDLLPLHLQVQKEAILGGLRIIQTESLKEGNLVGHISIIKKLSQDVTTKPVDYIHRLNFERPFEIVIDDLQGAKQNESNFSGSTIWYTDGSKTENGVGVGVYGPKCKITEALGTTPTIFQAEIFAIELCIRQCLLRDMRRTRIYIYSDSQAALRALQSCTIKSKLVWNCLQLIKKLGTHNKVTLEWVPGHNGIKGNELADRLAKEGADSRFVGPEPYFGIPKCHIRKAVQQWEEQEKSSYWNLIPGQKQAKRFINPSSKRTKELIELSKPELRHITGLLTGHCPLRYHLNKMGKAESNLCRFCGNRAETAEHVLCECKALVRQRLLHLGKACFTPDEMVKAPPRKILGLYKSLGIEE